MSVDSYGQSYLPSLGTHLRARYNTQSYGQEEGNLDLGTMKLFNWDEGSASFIDGQVTMNDEAGVGYNIGLGHRVILPSLTPWEQDPAKIYGLSIWADGSQIGKDQFFPQIGISLEYLGDLWDLRSNIYIPLEDTKIGEASATGNLEYSGNFLLQETLARQDTALTVSEVELARRIGNRDAWGFVGGYSLYSDEFETEGYRVGARGYLLPDLLLQVAVTDDDLFHTNTVVSVIWFIGRTRGDYCPTGTLTDRMREPVMRNDYVATMQSTVTGGDPLIDPNTDEPIRIVHANSAAPDGGDGTFEAPLNNLDNVAANSMEGDIVLMYAESVFTEQTAHLQIEQRLLGEGGNNPNSVNTVQRGVVELPATSPGALSAAVPVIDNTAVNAVVTRDFNEIANFGIDGGANGIVAPMEGSGSAFIHDLTIDNVTGDGISLASFSRLEENGDTTVSFNVTINEVDFDNVGGNDIVLDAFTAEDLNSPDVDLDETINVANVTSTNNGGAGIVLTDTHMGGTFNLNQYDYDGGAGSTNGVYMENIAGSVSSMNTTITGGSAAGRGIEVQNGTGTINFQSTVLVDDYAGTAVLIDGGDAGTITFAGDINNTAQRSIEVRDRSGGTVTFSSTSAVNDDGAGILVANNTGGTINFQGTYDLDSTVNNAVTNTSNTGATINYTNLDIDTTSGDGFVATGGGTIGVSGITNSISTDQGVGLDLQNITVASGGITFDEVNVSNGTTNGINIENVTGGQVTVGMGFADGDGGSLTTMGDAIRIVNAANVDLNDVRVVSAGGVALFAEHTNNTAFDLRVDNLDVDAATMAIDANADGTGKFDLFVTGGTFLSAVDFEGNGSGNIDFTFQNSEIATGNDDLAFRLELDSQVDDADITITGNTISTGDATAFAFISAGNAKVVDFLFDNNSVTNNSANRTAEMIAQSSTLLNATVRDNTFSNVMNAGTDDNLLIESVSNATTINLDIDGNTAVGGNGDLHLLITNGTFNVVERDDANANNNNQINFDPAIGNFGDISSVPTP